MTEALPQLSARPVLVVDFGAQYAQLIARRVREANVYSEVVPHTMSAAEMLAKNPAAIVLSGGPSSVYAEGAPALDAALLTAGVPVFGMCYGFQAMVQALGGTVAHTGLGEYGSTLATVSDLSSTLFNGQVAEQSVWMSHGDSVTEAPPGMKVTDLGKSGRTFRVNFVKDDEIMSGLVDFAEKNHIHNAHFSGLGALSKGTFGWTDVERGLGQKKVELNQEAEVVSFLGSISTNNQGQVTVHGHGSVAIQDGSVKGGHWFEAHVGIIAEIFVTEEEATPEPVK